MDPVTKGWVQHLRRHNARQESTGRSYQCPLCEAEVQPNIEAFRAHIRSDAVRHGALSEEAAIQDAFEKITLHGNVAPKSGQSSFRTGLADSSELSLKTRPSSGDSNVTNRGDEDSTAAELGVDESESSRRGSKRVSSLPGSTSQQRGSSPPTPGRSRARPNDATGDFDRGTPQRNRGRRQLWSPDDDQPRTTSHKAVHGRHGGAGHRGRGNHPRGHKRHADKHHNRSQVQPDATLTTQIIRQPDTRDISSDQLVGEVKGIYAGLVLLEGKCIEYDSSQQSADLGEEQYQALINLHRSVLHEHHDFFLASQHPSASAALRQLAAKYAMPARMWRHGIHSFLELLRHKLPGSLEHMLTFIYIAYSMMALLYETVPTFEDTWVECLGDLGRYRMAIEDDDIRDRETWTSVSRYWYAKASDKAPTTGRLYHHLAILARPNALQQLFYYAKSLCVPVPFSSARDSIMTLFDPLLDPSSAAHQRLEPVDAAFVRFNGILFSRKAMRQLDSSATQFFELLDSRIGWMREEWIEPGYHMGISLSCLLLDYGRESNPLMKAIPRPRKESDQETVETSQEDLDIFSKARSFAARAYEIVMNRWGERSTLPFLHTTFVFLRCMTRHPEAIAHLEGHVPWTLMAIVLNHLLETSDFAPRIDTDDFPGPEKTESPHPLPEDYAMRGLLYADKYFPDGWFEHANVDDDEKYFEQGSTMGRRCERILWIGREIAKLNKWLLWDATTRQFSVATVYLKPLEYPLHLEDDEVSMDP